MQKEEVTIKDIARELGISPSTVSRALKDHPDISQETKKVVNELAKKLNYRPNPIALSLKGGSSRMIGVVVPEIVHFFFSTVLSGVEDYADEMGYNVIICQSNEIYDNEVKNTDALISARVDGIMVSLAKTTKNFEHFNSVLERNIPLVFFDRVCTEIDTDRVVIDDEEGAYKATQHLIDRGKKNIVHLAGPPGLDITQKRTDGYRRALTENGIPVNEENIVRCDSVEATKDFLPAILNRVPLPDALFCVNDLTAAQAMKMVKRKNLKVPEDIAIVGFTNGQISALTDPAITSVDQKGYDMGREAARLLIERIAEKNRQTQTIIIRTDLIIRGSTGI